MNGENEELTPGEPIIIEPPYNRLDVNMTYKFKLPNGHNYGDGSTYTIEVPEVFSIPQVAEPEELSLGDTVFGSFTTNGNNIEIKFNEQITNHSNIAGEIKLKASFDEDYNGPAEPGPITIPINGEESLEFPIKFIPSGSSIDKNGVPNKDYNTETIT